MFVARLLIRLHKIDVTDTKSSREVEESHYRRIASFPFEITDILLSEALSAPPKSACRRLTVPGVDSMQPTRKA